MLFNSVIVLEIVGVIPGFNGACAPDKVFANYGSMCWLDVYVAISPN